MSGRGPLSTPTRRGLLLGGLGAAAGLLLAGCGDDASEKPPTTTDTDGAGTFPVNVNHQFGSTTIPTAPERAVALGWGDADVLLALGVVPVGILDWFQAWPQGVGPWAQDRLGGATPQVLTGPEINFEQLASLAPDLVTFVKSDNDKTTYGTVSEIAPTLSGPAGTPPYGTAWQDQTIMIAQAVGRPADGQKLIADTTAKLAAAKAANPAFAGKTVCVVAAFSGQYGAYVRQDSRVQFMEGLGFVNSPGIEALKPESFFAQVSRERAALLDADLTVIFAIGGEAAALREDKVLNSIPSARNGRLLIVDDADTANAFSTGSVLSIDYSIEKFVPRIAEIVK